MGETAASVQEKVKSVTASAWVADCVSAGWEAKRKEHKAIRKLQPSIRAFCANRDKNRDPLTPVFDENRVVLRPLIRSATASSKMDAGYINASWLAQGSAQPLILTQLPLKATIADLWHMVWQEDVHVIACLQDLHLEGDDGVYLPLKPNTTLHCKGKDTAWTVETTGLEAGQPNWVHRHVLLRNEKTSEPPRRISHFSFLKWPGDEKARPPDSLLDFVETCERANCGFGVTGGLVSPLVLQCGNGAARSGTTAALSMACEHLDATHTVAVPHIVANIRRLRYGAVPHFPHYVFINRRLLHHAKASKLVNKDDPNFTAVNNAFSHGL